MERIITILERIWQVVRKNRARLLARLYACFDRQQSSRIIGPYKKSRELHCKDIEDLCMDFHLVTPSANIRRTSNLITWYITKRFTIQRRCLFFNEKGKEIKRLPDNTPAEASIIDDYILSLISVIGKIRQATECPTGINLRPEPSRAQQHRVLLDNGIHKGALSFNEAEKKAYEKEKEETSVLKSRVASMAAVNTVQEDVTEYVLRQFNADNGYTVEISALQDGLKDCFNIIWVDSVIDSINEKYWGQLRTSLISADDSKYHISQKHLKTICHE